MERQVDRPRAEAGLPRGGAGGAAGPRPQIPFASKIINKRCLTDTNAALPIRRLQFGKFIFPETANVRPTRGRCNKSSRLPFSQT
ncbi:hypothetical protein EVAR_17512_1 [Eumeta japonica]|uniref:Uncharacterized protein n=1 Tax=Eumeta variegata TaxID=151549 RepID=A0A4C1WTH9_EUMVA|nr:hypothetical protein EVAR_17512_1 [Eumeta japonica]